MRGADVGVSVVLGVLAQLVEKDLAVVQAHVAVAAKNFNDRTFVDFQRAADDEKETCRITGGKGILLPAYLSELAELGGSNGGCILAAMFRRLRRSRARQHRSTTCTSQRDHPAAYCVVCERHAAPSTYVHGARRGAQQCRTRPARSVFPKPWERPHHPFDHPPPFSRACVSTVT